MALIAVGGYKLDIDLETALKPENFLAYEWEGQPVPILNGFPLRAVFPGRPGSIWVKGLVELKLS
jgi:sulfite dehydrogenase